MKKTNIESVVKKFKSKSTPDHRYTSFDYCYNYFITTKDITKDIEKSCLVLGFYLASWGMYRGSSFILQNSLKIYESTIRYIATLDASVWNIDVDKYDDTTVQKIIEIYDEIKARLILDENKHLTLITKLLLGVFGFVPAYDQFFCNTFSSISKGKCGYTRLNLKSLMSIKSFYVENKAAINKLSARTFTTDFLTGKKTAINYSKAKIIDMYGFTIGLKKGRN